MKTTVQIGGSGMVLLTIVFFLAKITGHIDWNWWLVFAPMWAPALILAVFIGFCVGIAVILK